MEVVCKKLIDEIVKVVADDDTIIIEEPDDAHDSQPINNTENFFSAIQE